LEYDGKKIQEYKKGMELNAAHQFLTHDDDMTCDVNFSDDNTNIIEIKQNTVGYWLGG
jgi:hypothetical protein